MTSEPFSAEGSLQLIQNMINKTQRNFSDHSHYFLLWGWAAFFAMIYIIPGHMLRSKYYKINNPARANL